MEKQQIVEKSVYTTLNGDVETNIFTNQFQQEIENIQILKQKIIYRGIKIVINEETFLSAVNNEDGTYTFYHLGYNEETEKEEWDLNGNIGDISDYGISLENGEPQGKDTIEVIVEDGEVVSSSYIEHTKLYLNENAEFDFVSFVADKHIAFCINEDENGRFIDLVYTTKFEAEIAPTPLDIDVWNYQLQDIETTLILAKKVEE